jgi:DNA-binding NarL/FixJ family response regulator
MRIPGICQTVADPQGETAHAYGPYRPMQSPSVLSSASDQEYSVSNRTGEAAGASRLTDVRDQPRNRSRAGREHVPIADRHGPRMPTVKPALTGASSLSPREWQVARLAAQGYKNPEIAAQLGIRPSTVKNTLRKAFDKTGMGTRLELAVWYHAHAPYNKDAGSRERP